MQRRRKYPTQKRLHELFTYHPSGWLVRRSTGRRAGCLATSGYWQTKIDGKLFYEHVLIFKYHKGYRPAVIDHINRDKIDNRIENLRKSSLSLNSMNTPTRKSSLGLRGIQPIKENNRKQKYRAYITFQRVNYSLGRFMTLKEAIKARRKAERDLGVAKCVCI